MRAATTVAFLLILTAVFISIGAGGPPAAATGPPPAAEESVKPAAGGKAEPAAPTAQPSPAFSASAQPKEGEEAAGAREEAVSITVERAFDFPEVYAGKPLLFEKVKIGGGIKSDDNIYYCLNVTGAEGRKVPAHLNRPGVTFVVSPDIMEKMLSTVAPGREYTATLRGAIESREILGNVYWLAVVTEADIFGEDGSVAMEVK